MRELSPAGQEAILVAKSDLCKRSKGKYKCRSLRGEGEVGKQPGQGVCECANWAVSTMHSIDVKLLQ